MMTYTFVFYADERPIARRYVKVEVADRYVSLTDKISLAFTWAEEKPGRWVDVNGPGLGGVRHTCCRYLADWVMREFAPKQPIQQEPAEWVDPWADLGIPI